MKKKIFFSVIFITTLLFFSSCKNEQNIKSESSKLIGFFKASNSNYPNISVHRGGKGLRNYPENCLETIKYVSDSINAIFEVDVAQTKDGKLILMHDNSLDRTTNGSGLVATKTYSELKDYVLVDDFGNTTPYHIPLFTDVLKWCIANDVILTVDIKRSVDVKTVIKTIKDTNAQDCCIIITYDIAQAERAYQLGPEFLLSVSARNDEELDKLLATEIPTENMLAFTGTRLSKTALYKRLHNEGIVCILGTLRNLDKQAKARGEQMYQQWKNLGVDILATDRPFEAYSAINEN